MDSKNLMWALGLVLLAAVSRFLPHPQNFTPVMAVALFASAVITPRFLGIAVALVAMLVSDIFLGWHRTMPFVYGAMLLVGLLGFFLREKRSVLKIVFASLTGSMLFFLITNLGVFLTEAMYPKTAEGLLQCYTMAIPFFRNSLTGDMLYTLSFFGIFALATRSSKRAVLHRG